VSRKRQRSKKAGMDEGTMCHSGKPYSNCTMARIFDNIDQDLLGTLRATMQVFKRK
jgi:hypothetical protein